MARRIVASLSHSDVSARPFVVFPRAPAYEPTDLVANKYRLVRQLGEGGTGTVWLARNVNLDAQIALKLIKGGARSPESAEQLLNEARAAARLRHPGIVRVFDYGQTERNEPFIVMEVLTGETLLELLDRERKLSATRAVQLLLPIADALASAHAQGVIHRDLKPDNVFITTSESLIQPKVVDFGFAKHGLSEGSPRGHEQAVAGGLRYMAPEQMLGRHEIDHRVDVWGFCAMLYECVAGRPPFDGAHYESLLFRIIDCPPVPMSDLGTADAALSRIVARGLSKQPERRWPNMRELGKALAAWLSRHGVTEDVSGKSLRAAWLGDPPSLAIAPGRALEVAPSAVRRLALSWRAVASVTAAIAAASGAGAAWLDVGAQRLRLDARGLSWVANAAAYASSRLRQGHRQGQKTPEESKLERPSGAGEEVRASVEGSAPRTSAAPTTLPLQGRSGRP